MPSNDSIPDDAEELSDHGLLKLIQEGNNRQSVEAMALVYRRYRDEVQRFAYSRVGCNDMAADITSDVFVFVIKKIHSYQWRGYSLRSWILGICINKAMEYMRKQQCNQVSLDGSSDDENEENPVLHAQLIASATMTECETVCAEDTTVERQNPLHIRLHEVVNSLPERLRRLIKLHYFDGKGYEEIAGILGMKLGTVRVNCLRARSLIKKRLMQKGIGDI